LENIKDEHSSRVIIKLYCICFVVFVLQDAVLLQRLKHLNRPEALAEYLKQHNEQQQQQQLHNGHGQKVRVVCMSAPKANVCS